MNREAPSLLVVAAGGIGTVAVVVFVAAIALGTRPAPAEPGDRLAVARTDGPAGLAVLVARCPSERVVAVEVGAPGAPPAWRIISRKGSIDERYVVGDDDVPLGFEAAPGSAGALPPGELVARVVVARDGEDRTDEMAFDPARVPPTGVLHRGVGLPAERFEPRALAVADCPGSGRDLTVPAVLFTLAGAGVFASYVAVVHRYVRGRRGR